MRRLLPFRLRDIMPRGLYPRSVLIAVVPVILLLAASTYVFYDSHWRQTSRKLSQGIASALAFIIQDVEQTPERRREIGDLAEEHLLIDFELDPEGTLPDRQPTWLFTPLDTILRNELDAHLDRPFWFDRAGPGHVEIRVQGSLGVYRFLVERDRTFSTTGHIFVVWVILSTLVLIMLSLGFLRNQVRSILNLADAAKAYGRGEDVGDFRPSGATEVREAARAVIDMKRRLTAFAEQRTALLAGVSHDLRTPLTRLKLQLAMLEETPDVRAARQDLDEMAAMLDEYLAFARGEEVETREPVTLDALLREAAGHHAAVTVHEPLPTVELLARPLALKRAISNLITNACQYGDRVEVRLVHGPYAAEILVDDNGPGIPQDRIEDAFRPFMRLDGSRSQNTPGTGLGLALARDTARAHGGDVRLEESPLGGLRARLRLPA